MATQQSVASLAAKESVVTFTGSHEHTILMAVFFSLQLTLVYRIIIKANRIKTREAKSTITTKQRLQRK